MSVVKFFQQTLQNFYHTGALAPSSPFMAKALVKPLRHRPTDGMPVRLLEAGPGTGAITLAIMRHLRPGDHLTLAEINGDFVKVLESRFQADPKWRQYREQVTIHHGPVEDLEAEAGGFHHIISGLPFNNFPPELVAQIFESFRHMVRPGGTVNYFEYAGIRHLKAPFCNPAERARLMAVGDVLAGHRRRAERSSTLVLLNFPPAVARSLSA